MIGDSQGAQSRREIRVERNAELKGAQIRRETKPKERKVELNDHKFKDGQARLRMFQAKNVLIKQEKPFITQGVQRFEWAITMGYQC